MEGNQMKIREALVALRNGFNNNVMACQDRYVKFSGRHWHKKAAEAAGWRDLFQELKEVCDAALSAPPRQCDVGTPEEIDARWDAYCYTHCYKRIISEDGISAKNCKGCAWRWAQTPYTAERKGENK